MKSALQRTTLLSALLLAPAAATLAPASRPSLARLRGGASTAPKRAPPTRSTPAPSTAAARRAAPRDEPALSARTAALVLSWAVLPTLLRITYAALTRRPDAAAPPTLFQAVGLAAAATPAALPALPLPARWQVAVAAAWAAGNLAVAVPGRYDGRAAMATDRPTAATANLFSPAGWAFAIWAPIFLGEWAMMLYLTNVRSAAPLGAAVAPGWVAGTLAQAAWCAAFRPSACGPRRLWLPTLLLGGSTLGLGLAHRASVSASASVRSRLLGGVLVRGPLALHFGWIGAAALVNLNNWLARIEASLALKEATALGSVGAAVGAALYVSATTSDPLYGLTIAWALAAVRADGGRAARGLVRDATLDRVRDAAAAGAVVAALAALAALAGVLPK